MQGWGSDVQGGPVPEPERRLGSKRGVTSGVAGGHETGPFSFPSSVAWSLLSDAIVNGMFFIVVKYTS